MTHAAAYLRVSTTDQDVESQRADVERLAAARGLELERVYQEHAPGAGAPRPVLEELRDAAHRGEFSTLIVWALDRLGRSMRDVLALVDELDRRGVQLVSVREPWLDLHGPTRGLLLGVFGWVAEQERARLGERTRAGIERARAKGVRLGRPPRRVDLRTALQLRAQGLSIRAVAERLGVPRATLHRALAGAEPPPA